MAIAVTRAIPQSSSRATVGSATELLDYLRLLLSASRPGQFARIARSKSLKTRPNRSWPVCLLPEGLRFMVSVPFAIADEADWTETCERLGQQGFVRGIAGGSTIDLVTADIPLAAPLRALGRHRSTSLRLG
ncbi:MAG: hypothetical protein R3B96_25135 [Pirellulaceae bacterium]